MSPRNSTRSTKSSRARDGLRFTEDICAQYYPLVVVVILIADLVFAVAIVQRVPYTEIDWKAYMQEVAGVLENRELDYRLLRGDTGPLVYPAGFVYFYSVLYWITDRGLLISRAQTIFAALHAAVLCLLFAIYRLCHIDCRSNSTYRSFSLLVVVLLPLSRRIMSLFVLRLFNDAVQVLFMYISILLFARNNWSVGCLMYSASISVKMNALLYAPGLAVLLCQALGPLSAFAHVIFICCGFQAVVGLPFLLHAPKSYLTKAFEFSRVFEYKWSVNGAFLSESNFLDRRLSAALVVTHILTLLLFGHLKWTPASQKGLLGLVGWRHFSQFGPSAWLGWARHFAPRKLRSAHVVFVLFSSNFIGIVFARTLHFQFYLWYFHTIPLLVAMAPLPVTVGIAVFAVIELVFNIYPPQSSAALALSASHLALLVALFMNKNIHETDVYQSQTNDGADLLHSREANPQDASSAGPQDVSGIGRKVA